MPTLPLAAPSFSAGAPRSGGRTSPTNLLEKLIGVDALRDLYARARLRGDLSFFDSVLAELEIKIRISDSDLARIPTSGPLIVCANHPFGILDGIALGATILRAREDVRILTNLLLRDIAELEQYCLWIDPFESDGTQNAVSIRRALRWLKQGGAIATFPAGEVSHWNFRDRSVADPAWNNTPVRLARMTGASIVPVHFAGQNSLIFQGLGCLHPRLRTLRLPGELMNKAGREVTLRVGRAIHADEFAKFTDDDDATARLRVRCEVLSTRTSAGTGSVASQPPAPIAAPQPREQVANEIQTLIRTSTLAENEEFVVVSARAVNIPSTLKELGRAREIAFRAEGEGSGQAVDLDEFDRYYSHLLLWDKRNHVLAGGYRIGSTQEILPRYGAAGLYTSTLFRYDQRFFHTMGAGLELGRSFILPEYQRRFAPLLLLWRGIAQFAAQHPDAPVLFGAVSVSAEYSRASRELIVRYFDECKPAELAELVRPRCPMRVGTVDQRRAAMLTSGLGDASALARLIGDIEPDSKSIPILLTQYLKLGGRVLAFNLDRKFSDVVDGLIYVDLRQTSDRVLSRYMSRDSLVRFRRFHAGSGFALGRDPEVVDPATC